MKAPRIALAALASALLLASCGNDDARNPTKPAAGPLLHFETGGGFAPRQRELIVDADGSAVLFGSDTEAAKFDLSDDELEGLQLLLEKTPAKSLGDEPSAYCADCFTYSLEYGGEDFTGDEATLSSDGQKVVAAVTSLADAHAVEPTRGERLIRYAVATGLSMQSSTLTIDVDGNAVLRGSQIKTEDFFVAPDEMQELRRTLVETPTDDLGPGIDPDCLDCPTVSLDYGGGHFETTSSKTSSALDDLTDQLESISAEHAMPRPGAVIE